MSQKKILNICLIIAGFFLYLVASQFAEQLFDWFDLPINQGFYITIPNLIGILVAGLGYVITLKSRRAMEFLESSVSELAKVSYPTLKEASQSAVVVVVLVSIATFFLWFFDFVWLRVTKFILSV
ncbi:MAG: preprotein translocase subunit SecE [Deltaproteobacteria bacterium]|nr:preprotein translocase subunit SecE [Deltaproteobacteria bacterium]